jgi:hypothetical protein
MIISYRCNECSVDVELVDKGDGVAWVKVYVNGLPTGRELGGPSIEAVLRVIFAALPAD